MSASSSFVDDGSDSSARAAGSRPKKRRKTRAGDAGLKLYCFCRQPFIDGDAMIQCERCDEWYHLRCLALTAEAAGAIEAYFCPTCQEDTAATALASTSMAPGSARLAGRTRTRARPFGDARRIARASRALEPERYIKCKLASCLERRRPGSSYCSNMCGLLQARLVVVQLLQRKGSMRAALALSELGETALAAAVAAEASARAGTGVGAAVSADAGAAAAGAEIATGFDSGSRETSAAVAAPRVVDALEADELARVTRRAAAIDARFAELAVELAAHQADVRRVHERWERDGAAAIDQAGVPASAPGGAASVDCPSCGKCVTLAAFVSHVNGCGAKESVQIIYTAESRAVGMAANLFCDAYDARRRTFCRQYRDSCPFHPSVAPVPLPLCGYPLGGESFCRLPTKECASHLGWDVTRLRRLKQERTVLRFERAELEDAIVALTERVDDAALAARAPVKVEV